MIDLFKYIKNRKAFTIAELIIAVSLLGLVLTMGYMLFSTMSNNFDRGTDQSYIQQNIRFVDEYFKNSIRNIGDFHIGTTQPADLGYSLFVEDEIAKADTTEITDSVLDDVMLTVDFSGEFVAFEYTVTGSDGDRTYEIENRIVLNNLPTDMISPEDMVEGTYNGEEISLQASKLFYDYDPVYKMIRVLKASPSIVTTGHTYTADAPLQMHLVVSNDSFLTGITNLDITLEGDIASLSISDMSRQNDKVVLLQLTGSTPGATAVGEGTITVADPALVGEGDLAVTLPVEDPVEAYMIIYGEEDILIPQTPDTSVTVDFTATVYDQGSNLFPSADDDIEWQWDPVTYEGVSFSATNNILSITVNDTASPGSIDISAHMTTNPIITWDYTVDLVDEEP